jgi:hypothetical protein
MYVRALARIKIGFLFYKIFVLFNDCKRSWCVSGMAHPFLGVVALIWLHMRLVFREHSRGRCPVCVLERWEAVPVSSRIASVKTS